MAAEAPIDRPLVAGGQGYVGSGACRSCHEEQYASWHASYHRTMTQAVGPETVLGDFSDVVVRLADGGYRLTQRDGRYFATLPEGATHEVVQSTGSHHYQLYWRVTGRGRELALLPLVWLIDEGRWVPRTAVFLTPPNHGQEAVVWNVNCLPCHSTNGRPSYRVEQGAAPVADTRVAELGIACEACHGPGGRHVEDRRAQSVVHPAKLPAARSVEVCGQCHSVNIPPTREAWVDWLLDGPTFRPGERLEESRYVAEAGTLGDAPLMAEWVRERPSTAEQWFWPDGEVRVVGREMNAIQASACFRGGELSCLSCHSPHADDPDDLLTVSRDGDEACLQCHDGYGTAEAVEAHTHHPAESVGSRCYNCHMPNTAYGLLKATRSHRISRPTAASDVEAGRPNACSLCHLDKPLGWAAARLEDWYGVARPELSAEQETVAAGPLGLLTGDAGERALWAWHLGWEPARAASGEAWQAPFLAATLRDPYAVVRAIAGRSLGRLPGFSGWAFDFVGAPAELDEAAERARGMWVGGEVPGAVPVERIEELLRLRDDRPVTLAE